MAEVYRLVRAKNLIDGSPIVFSGKRSWCVFMFPLLNFIYGPLVLLDSEGRQEGV